MKQLSNSTARNVQRRIDELTSATLDATLTNRGMAKMRKLKDIKHDILNVLDAAFYIMVMIIGAIAFVGMITEQAEVMLNVCCFFVVIASIQCIKCRLKRKNNEESN